MSKFSASLPTWRPWLQGTRAAAGDLGHETAHAGDAGGVGEGRLRQLVDSAMVGPFRASQRQLPLVDLIVLDTPRPNRRAEGDALMQHHSAQVERPRASPHDADENSL